MSPHRFCVPAKPWVAAVSIVVVLTCCPAWAALGGAAASVQSDAVALRGNLQTRQAAGALIHEITMPTGVVVREYVSAAGTVFAIAWQGPWPPDLRQLLGSYFEPYVQAAKMQASQHPGRRPLRIQQAGLVVETRGHPRNFAGRAYIPELLPNTVRAEDIR